MELLWEGKILLDVGVDDLILLDNEHGCNLLTCGCGGVGAREWKALYWTEEKAPKINMFQVFSSGLYIPMAMSLFLFVNDFVYVCRL